MVSKNKKSKTLNWEEAPEIKKMIKKIIKHVDLPHININNIFTYRTSGSTSRSYARIWSFPKIFQVALDLEPYYVIEVLSKYFDKLNTDEQIKVIIHELLHIPKNFSGALLPHRTKGRHLEKQANEIFKIYKQKTKK